MQRCILSRNALNSEHYMQCSTKDIDPNMISALVQGATVEGNNVMCFVKSLDVGKNLNVSDDEVSKLSTSDVVDTQKNDNIIGPDLKFVTKCNQVLEEENRDLGLSVTKI